MITQLNTVFCFTTTRGINEELKRKERKRERNLPP